jgi:hypothetical protein
LLYFGEDDSTPGLQSDDDILVTLLDNPLRASATPVQRILTGVFTRGQLNEDSTVGAFDELKSFVRLTPRPGFEFIGTFTAEGNQLEVGV